MSWTDQFFSPQVAPYFSKSGILSRQLQSFIFGSKEKEQTSIKCAAKERRLILLESTFSLLAYIAKADYFVSKREAKLLHHLIHEEMNLKAEIAHLAIKFFNANKLKSKTEAKELAHKLYSYWAHDPKQLQHCFNACLAMALADDWIYSNSDSILLQLCKEFKIPPINYMPIRQAFLHPNAEAYEILSLGAQHSQEEIKTQWRKLCKAYHPDHCQDSDAAEKLDLINQAYKRLKA